jgi:FKBP-type peptidyl-prolyl cis-trans isomerase 2
MTQSQKQAKIELGMKVSVQRSNRDRIGVVTRIEGDYVVVRWTGTELREEGEYYARRDEVMVLAGWL